jgi:hypothetical protein
LDDDTALTATAYALAVPQNQTMEGAGAVLFTVTRSGDTTGTGTSYFRTNGGLATGGSNGSDDYDIVSNMTLNWAAGETVKSILVKLNNDSVAEGYETIIGQHATDSGFTTPASATARLYDDDIYVYSGSTAETLTLFPSALPSTAGTHYRVDTGDGADIITYAGNAAAGDLGAVAQAWLGAGDDTLIFSAGAALTSGMARFDLGAGVDTLQMGTTTAGTLIFDFTASSGLSSNVSQRLVGLEILDLSTNTGAQTVKLNLQDVLEWTTGNAVDNVLRINGSNNDIINLQALGKVLSTPSAGASITDVTGSSVTVSASTAGSSSANDVTIGGNNYDVYQYQHAGEQFTLLIQHGITVNTVL